jgi:hypothetical protein
VDNVVVKRVRQAKKESQRMKRRLSPTASPFVLSTESVELFDDERRSISAAVKPRNRIEQMYTDDISCSSWHMLRLRRSANAIIKLAMPESLFKLLSQQLNVELTRTQDLVVAWSNGDPGAKAAVSSILQQHGLDESAIEAGAIIASLPSLAAVEQLLASNATRRDKGLSGIAFCREMEARRAQNVASQKEVAQIEDAPRVLRSVKHG